MHKLNAKGFAHQVLIMALIVVAVIGGIGSYIYLHKSSAAINVAGICGSAYSKFYKSARVTYNGSYGPANLVVYHSGQYNDDFCAMTVALSPAYGSAHTLTTIAQVWHVKQNSSTWSLVSSKKDSGSYKYYAGPVRQNNIISQANTDPSTVYYAGMTFVGKIYYNGHTYSATLH